MLRINCCVFFVKQTNLESWAWAFASEITPLAQIIHMHPFLLCCCGLRTSSNASLNPLLPEISSFFVSRFSPEVCNTKDDRIGNAKHRILLCQVPTLLRTLSNDTRMLWIAMIIVECDLFGSFSIQQYSKCKNQQKMSIDHLILKNNGTIGTLSLTYLFSNAIRTQLFDLLWYTLSRSLHNSLSATQKMDLTTPKATIQTGVCCCPNLF